MIIFSKRLPLVVTQPDGHVSALVGPLTISFGPLIAGTTYYILFDPETTAPVSQTFYIDCPCFISCPTNISVNNDPNQCGAVVNLPLPITIGNCGTVTYLPASGSFFPVGTTIVQAISYPGSTCTFTVTVTDTQAPSVTCPANIIVSNGLNQCGAVVNSVLQMELTIVLVAIVSVNPASGTFFPVGTTTVTVTAVDISPNSPNTICTFSVTVQDTQAPAVTCPANITVPNVLSMWSRGELCFSLGSDNRSGVTVTGYPASGSFFRVGTIIVTVTALDASPISPMLLVHLR